MPTHISRRAQQTRRVTPQFSWRPLLLSFLSLILAVLLVFSGLLVWRWMQKPTSFPIRHIIIQGQLTHEPPAVIQHILQTQLSGGFFSLNVFAVKQAILSYPWVASVSFRRVWPHTLIVKIDEQQAIARFGKNGALNEQGQIFYPDAKTLPQHLPDLEGSIDQSQALLGFYRNVNMLSKLLGFTVVSLHVNAEQNFRLRLSNQLEVMLGRQEALPRFKRFVAIYPKIAAATAKPMVSVDLRYPNGVAVRY